MNLTNWKRSNWRHVASVLRSSSASSSSCSLRDAACDAVTHPVGSVVDELRCALHADQVINSKLMSSSPTPLTLMHAAAVAAVAAVGLTCLVVFLPQACLSGNGILHTVCLSPPSYLLCLCKRSTYSDDNTHNFYSPARL